MTTGLRRESEKVENKYTEPISEEVSKQSTAEHVLLTEQVSNLKLTDTPNLLFLCDAGYGLPSEARPRREKILAICRQLYNFIKWQSDDECNKGRSLAQVKVVGSLDVVNTLQERLQQLCGNSDLPPHVEFCSGQQPLEDYIDDDTIYLSPDATAVLDASQKPPSTIVVGLLIDRRTIQLNRSKKRALLLNVKAARWPLEEFSNIDKQEPLNVDTIMEGMQQWWWNCETCKRKECFIQAATQAIERHCQRHPNRPLHKTTL